MDTPKYGETLRDTYTGLTFVDVSLPNSKPKGTRYESINYGISNN